MGNIESIVRANLEAIGEDYDTLLPSEQERLIMIETEIGRRHAEQMQAEAAIKSADYSIKSIAKAIGAGRTTMYLHEHLPKRYIEQSTAEIISGSPYAEISRLKEDKAMLQDQVDKMMERDVDMELLRTENRNLTTIISDRKAEIERLEKRVKELSEENKRLKSGEGNGQDRRVFRRQ